MEPFPPSDPGMSGVTGPGHQEGWTVARFCADGGSWLRAEHRRVASGQSSPIAAAVALTAWTGGTLAAALARSVAVLGDAPLVGDATRWSRHPGGWFDGVFLGPGPHPAATVDTVDATLRSMVEALAPVVAVLHDLAPIGEVGLWNEVADGLVTWATRDPWLVPTEELVRRLDALVRWDGAPWRAVPRIALLEGSGGPMVVVQKGGCCLVHTLVASSAAGERAWCSNCSLRTWDDCVARRRR